MSVRRITTLLLVIILALGASVASAQTTAPLRTEVPESGEFAINILQSGARITDSFSGFVGTKLYGFQGVEGDVVSVTMTQITDGLDPFLVILGPNGEVVASDDDSGSPFLASAIEGAILPATGSYFIIASSYVNIDAILEDPLLEEQEYTLTLDGNSDVSAQGVDPNLLNITATEVDFGQRYNGTSTVETPATYYLIGANAGQVLDFALSSNFDSIIHLFDAVGNRIGVSIDPERTGRNNLFDFEMPYTGGYLLIVTDIFFYSAPEGEDATLPFTGGDYTLTISAR